METVVLVIHLLLVAAMVAIILVQRSEGGALGIGGGGNFMATRGTGNALTRATTILAAGFFITSIGLTILARSSNDASGVFENLPVNELPADATGEPTTDAGGLMNLLGGDTTTTVPADAGDTAAPASAGASAGDTPAVPADAGSAGAAAPATDSAAAPPAVPADAGN